jgi:hypothetical protein
MGRRIIRSILNLFKGSKNDNSSKNERIIKDLGCDWANRAVAWRNEHRKHVESLVKEAEYCYPPCMEDRNNPAIWKAASWVWLKKLEKELE